MKAKHLLLGLGVGLLAVLFVGVLSAAAEEDTLEDPVEFLYPGSTDPYTFDPPASARALGYTSQTNPHPIGPCDTSTFDVRAWWFNPGKDDVVADVTVRVGDFNLSALAYPPLPASAYVSFSPSQFQLEVLSGSGQTAVATTQVVTVTLDLSVLTPGVVYEGAIKADVAQKGIGGNNHYFLVERCVPPPPPPCDLPELTVSIATTDAAFPGALMTWTVAVTNVGPGTATNVYVTVSLSSNLIAKSPTTAALGDMASGSSVTFTVTTRVSLLASPGEEVSATATVVYGNLCDPNAQHTAAASSVVVLGRSPFGTPGDVRTQGFWGSNLCKAAGLQRGNTQVSAADLSFMLGAISDTTSLAALKDLSLASACNLMKSISSSTLTNNVLAQLLATYFNLASGRLTANSTLNSGVVAAYGTAGVGTVGQAVVLAETTLQGSPSRTTLSLINTVLDSINNNLGVTVL